MKIREEALEVPEPKPEKKEENVITGITEDRLLELMRQAYTEFWADMIIRLKNKEKCRPKTVCQNTSGLWCLWQADVFSREEP